jgi:hypothetical protein
LKDDAETKNALSLSLMGIAIAVVNYAANAVIVFEANEI